MLQQSEVKPEMRANSRLSMGASGKEEDGTP